MQDDSESDWSLPSCTDEHEGAEERPKRTGVRATSALSLLRCTTWRANETPATMLAPMYSDRWLLENCLAELR